MNIFDIVQIFKSGVSETDIIKEKNKTIKQNKTNKQTFEQLTEKKTKAKTKTKSPRFKTWIGLQQLCKNMLKVSYNVSYIR